MRIFIVIFLGCVLLSACSMDGIMYNSLPLSSYALSTAVIPDTSRIEVALASDGETIYGYYVRQTDSLRVKPHPVVIYHHGNRDNIENYWERVELLYKAGFDVFIYDYRGFGRSSGTCSEAGMQSDARAVLTYVRGRKDVDTSYIIQYGYSLGGYPALYSATALHSPRALITESIFASGEALVQSGTLLNIPGSYLLIDPLDNIAPMQKRTCPVLLLHGTADTFISVETSGQRLYDIARQPKTFVKVQGAGHTSVPQTLGTQNYIDLITAFIRGN